MVLREDLAEEDIVVVGPATDDAGLTMTLVVTSSLACQGHILHLVDSHTAHIREVRWHNRQHAGRQKTYQPAQHGDKHGRQKARVYDLNSEHDSAHMVSRGFRHEAIRSHPRGCALDSMAR